jgi:hypothetical protein
MKKNVLINGQAMVEYVVVVGMTLAMFVFMYKGFSKAMVRLFYKLADFLAAK